MKKTLFISIIIAQFLLTSMIFAEETDSDNGNGPIVFNQNYAQVPYTPQVVYDSGRQSITYGSMHVFHHNLTYLPSAINILFIDANNKITSTNFSQWSLRDKRWLGIQWDRSYCDFESCHLSIAGSIGTGGQGYDDFVAIRIVMYK